jgi:hypothetical protein
MALKSRLLLVIIDGVPWRNWRRLLAQNTRNTGAAATHGLLPQ